MVQSVRITEVKRLWKVSLLASFLPSWNYNTALDTSRSVALTQQFAEGEKLLGLLLTSTGAPIKGHALWGYFVDPLNNKQCQQYKFSA